MIVLIRHAHGHPLKKTDSLKTTVQRLDRIVKSARKIMRKDKGLNGDLDRLPMLTWIMFLKFLDDMERLQKDEATLAGKAFEPANRSALSLARLGCAGRRNNPT
jgi:hypothetical protein